MQVNLNIDIRHSSLKHSQSPSQNASSLSYHQPKSQSHSKHSTCPLMESSLLGPTTNLYQQAFPHRTSLSPLSDSGETYMFMHTPTNPTPAISRRILRIRHIRARIKTMSGILLCPDFIPVAEETPDCLRPRGVAWMMLLFHSRSVAILYFSSFSPHFPSCERT